MNDLHDKLSTLQAQLAAARAELEAAQAKAAETDDLHEKLNHITRARAAQDVISSIESEIAAVQHAIAEAKRREHRAELLERARSIAAEVGECREDLEALLYAIAQAVSALQRQGPAIVARWRSARERFITLFSSLEPGPWPHLGGDTENSQRLEALERVIAELGGDARTLLRLPPGIQPSNRLESTTFEGRNWEFAPPQTAQDFSLLVLDSILSRPFAQQPAAVAAPDSSKSL